MICAPATARPAFRVGSTGRNGRERSEDGADDHPSRNAESAPEAQSPHGEAASKMDGWLVSQMTTKLYDRTTDEITVDEVERIAI